MVQALEYAELIGQLRRQRWWLWTMIVASAVIAWWFFPIWALTIVCLVLAVKNEWVIHRGRRVINE